MYWILVGDYDLMLISGTCLALSADKWNFSILKFITTDRALLYLEMQHQILCSI